MNRQKNKTESFKYHYSLDVIIPVYHPDEKLEKLLRMLYRQTIIPDRVIILHTQDATGKQQTLPEIEDSNITVVPIEKKSFDHGGTRKLGAALSDADILLFMTQDAVPANDVLIEKLLKPYQDNMVAATYARQLSDETSDPLEQFTRSFNYPKQSRVKSMKDLEELGIKTFFCSDVCATYRNSVYQKLGGFVEKTIFNEDMIMAAGMIRANYKVAYASEAKVMHSHTYTYRQQFTRNFDLGVSHRQFFEVFDGLKSESEGIKLVKESIRYLIKIRKVHLIPDLLISSAFKYFGYQIGKRYVHLPKSVVLRFSMNKSYWN